MNFAPYAPPPDERRKTNSSAGSSKPESTPNWQSKPNPSTNLWSSYQHGGAVVDPTGILSQSSHQQPSSFPTQATANTTNSYSRNLAQEAIPGPDLRRGTLKTYLNAEAYETRLGWRVDLLSGLAYLTPLMGFIILVIETKNDYVRIHAYQSLLAAIPLGILHFLFLSSHFFQSLLLFLDLGLYAWMGYQAYRSAEVLERNLLPIIGPVAEQWTAEE